jgi:hypothetical protein
MQSDSQIYRQKLSLREIVFLFELAQEHSCRIGAVPTKQRNVED